MKKTMTRGAWSVWSTGGGCECWGRELEIRGKRYEAMITADECGELPAVGEAGALGVYEADTFGCVDDEWVALYGDRPPLIKPLQNGELDFHAADWLIEKWITAKERP